MATRGNRGTRGKGDVRYLQPINVESGNQQKYCRSTTRIQITCCVL